MTVNEGNDEKELVETCVETLRRRENVAKQVVRGEHETCHHHGLREEHGLVDRSKGGGPQQHPDLFSANPGEMNRKNTPRPEERGGRGEEMG